VSDVSSCPGDHRVLVEIVGGAHVEERAGLPLAFDEHAVPFEQLAGLAEGRDDLLAEDLFDHVGEAHRLEFGLLVVDLPAEEGASRAFPSARTRWRAPLDALR
jgi:hypothetical protein